MMIRKIALLTLLFCTLVACSEKFVRNVEARDDAREYEAALLAQSNIKNVIAATMETSPVIALDVDDDSADDPAIWVNNDDPSKSVIFGSNKLYGIHSYDLDGKELQYVSVGKINNIDVRQGINRNGKSYDVLAGSNRSDKSVDIFLINKNGMISSIPDFKVGLGDFKPYGFCLYLSTANELFAFVNDKKGRIFQIKIDILSDTHFDSANVRSLKLDTQVEGMVADDTNGILYVGEEQTGIHLFDADADGSTKGILLTSSADENPHIRYDIEGLALLPPHYLVASSQGNFSYAIFDLRDQSYVTSFKIGAGKYDGAEETDGIEIINRPLGNQFPHGVMIAQDGFNFDNDVKQNQNFKVVSLGEIYKILNPAGKQ
jgi:3-phytase